MSKKKNIVSWKYIGRGEFVPGIPTKNLTTEEVEKRGIDPETLDKSGLYLPQYDEKKDGE